MDKAKREWIEAALTQGQTFQRLTMHGDWDYFRTWLETARSGYEAKAHSPNSRDNHVTLARALEGFDALNNLLEGFDRAIGDIAKHTKELDEADRADPSK